MGVPIQEIFPSSGFSIPAMIERSVDFPQPLGPSKATISPGEISNVIPARTCVSAKDLAILEISKAGLLFNVRPLNNPGVRFEDQSMEDQNSPTSAMRKRSIAIKPPAAMTMSMVLSAIACP